MSVSTLAILGGDRAVPADIRPPAWPAVTEEEQSAVQEVLRSGKLTSAASGERHIPLLEQEWAAAVGTGHCVAVASGTAALTIALAAAGVGRGDEVIVPALSFVGSALAPVHLGAVPVFVDVDPATFNLDVSALGAALSSRTVAVMPVHLHGLPADMDEVLQFAHRHQLAVIEDAAQSHGVPYRGRVTGSIGDLGAFSLNASKNLPTCGEGGLITTDDATLAATARLLRQFGERIPERGERRYVSQLAGWNAKLNPIQAAFTRRQLRRLDEQQRARNHNVRVFLDRIRDLPWLTVPAAPDDRGHGWHLLRFRVRPAAFGLPADTAPTIRAVVSRALRTEGVPVSRYQSMPLPEQPVFQQGRAPYRTAETPVTQAVVDDSFVLQRAHLHPESGPLLHYIACALEKVWKHRGLLADMAAGRNSARNGGRPLVEDDERSRNAG